MNQLLVFKGKPVTGSESLKGQYIRDHDRLTSKPSRTGVINPSLLSARETSVPEEYSNEHP